MKSMLYIMEAFYANKQEKIMLRLPYFQSHDVVPLLQRKERNEQLIVAEENSVEYSNLDVGRVISWACSTVLTVVGVGAWVLAVIYSDGQIMVVSRWVIKYVALPSLICNWL
jgi:hypothetical protein